VSTAAIGEAIDDLPIFALGTVLFPGGALPLRVFEKRYMDMARDCLKTHAPFGVCLIRAGTEVGSPALTHAIGCLAEIGECDMRQLGVLHLTARGTRRFRVEATRVQADGLIRARATLLPHESALAVAPEYAGCADLLRATLPQLPAALLPPPHDFDDATWVSCRLAEVLPIPPLARQKLLELDDAGTRLELLRRFLEQQGLRQ
jgi:hypothetical protein